MMNVLEEILSRPSNEGRAAIGGLSSLLVPKPTHQRTAPPVAAEHTMRAQAILALGDSTKHQNLALQHLEAAFVAANPSHGKSR